MRTKKCIKCKKILPLEAFGKHCISRDGLAGRCKSCRSADARLYRKLHPEKVRQQKQESDKRCRQRLRDHKIAYRRQFPDIDLRYQLRKYDLSLEQFRHMVAEQNNCCKLCGRPPRFGRRRLSVDHIEGTKKVRGLLCDACNRALGLFQHDPDLMEKAAVYVRQHQ